MEYLLTSLKESVRGVFFHKLLLLLVVAAFIVTGCSKTKTEEEPVGAPLDLIVQVAGVDSDIILPNAKMSSTNKGYMAQFASDKSNRTTFTKDDVAFDVLSDQSRNSSGFEESLDKGLKHRLYAATSVPMENNIKYRLLLYTSADVLVASIEATAGQAEHITVTSGSTYKWYAYSYNTNGAIAAPNPANPVLTTPTDSPLLYASGTITPTALGTVLPITFKHQLTQLKVEVKESTGFRAILATNGEFANPDYVKTSAFNILTGQKTGTLTSANVTTLNFVSQVDADTVKSVAQYYTADNSLTTYNVQFNDINVQYTQFDDRLLDAGDFPQGGNLKFTFASSPANKKGYILKGTLRLAFRLPTMNILPFSNDNVSNGYRLADGTGAGTFLRQSAYFGQHSDYVRIEGLAIQPPTSGTEATSTSTGWNRFKAIMSNPANYPDVLVFANHYNYLNDEGWDLLKRYIDAGGNVLYTHDDAAADTYGSRGLSNILGQSVLLERNAENYSVYKFTDTPDGAADTAILNGPFGDVRPYHWGQDRIGTSYVTGYTGNDLIIYTTHAQNMKAPAKPGMAFFRHKTKGFIFVGDGGFYLNVNTSSPGILNRYKRYPFRVNTATVFPEIVSYGLKAESGSPTYGDPGTNKDGAYEIANSIMFGNMMSWLLNRAHYYGVNRN